MRAEGAALAVPLWQQRRMAAGEVRQQQASAAPLLSMDQLLQQLLSWDPATLMSGGGSELEGLSVPVRFESLGHYTQVSWPLGWGR